MMGLYNIAKNYFSLLFRLLPAKNYDKILWELYQQLNKVAFISITSCKN